MEILYAFVFVFRYLVWVAAKMKNFKKKFKKYQITGPAVVSMLCFCDFYTNLLLLILVSPTTSVRRSTLWSARTSWRPVPAHDGPTANCNTTGDPKDTAACPPPRRPREPEPRILAGGQGSLSPSKNHSTPSKSFNVSCSNRPPPNPQAPLVCCPAARLSGNTRDTHHQRATGASIIHLAVQLPGGGRRSRCTRGRLSKSQRYKNIQALQTSSCLCGRKIFLK